LTAWLPLGEPHRGHSDFPLLRRSNALIRWTPLFKGEVMLLEWAEKEDRFCSFLNPEIYSTYDESVFKEALVDWGYFGQPETRPSWLAPR
jgi:hypothetical protein